MSDHSPIFARGSLDAASGGSRVDVQQPSAGLPGETPGDRSSPGARLVSLDALRGFDMFWIVGAGIVVQALDKMSSNAFTTAIATQLKHVTWEGFRCYDLIFPLFLFIIGVSIVFSLDKAFARGGRGHVLARVLRRSVLLFAIGVFYYGGLSQPWPDVQLGGVLPRIALCYLGAALIYSFLPTARGLLAAAAVLLVGYWALMTFVPFPDLKLEKPIVEEVAGSIDNHSPFAIAAAVPTRVRGVYEEGRNLCNYLDFLFLPGKKAQLYYINEGLLSTLPSIALSLFGAMAGLLLKDNKVAPSGKIGRLVIAGVVGILLGLLWSAQFPLIKRIWTSSFILVASGLSALLLALFYYVVDVKERRQWCQPFVWIGCNPLTIYVTAQVVGFQTVAARFAGGDVKNFFDTHVAKGAGALVIALVSLTLVMLFARFLYRRKIFLRV